MGTKKVTKTKAPADKAKKGEADGQASKQSKATKPRREPKPKKVSAIAAAAKVLGEKGEPMNCQAMIAAMAEKGYWKSANGQTPAATLYSAILRELRKGKESRFAKAERGKFALADGK